MQTRLLFTLPPRIDTTATLGAADWRQRVVQAGLATWDEINHIRVVAVRELLWFFAGDPAGDAWLSARLDDLAGLVASTVGQAVAMEASSRSVGVRAVRDRLWAYRIPRLVVEKNRGDWGAHFHAELPGELLARLERKMEAALCRELSAWGRLPFELAGGAPFVVIADPGRAVPIASIAADRSGHGKALTVLVRANVLVLSYWRLEGDLFAGPLSALGYGRLLRGTPPDLLSPRVQRALLAITPEDQETC